MKTFEIKRRNGQVYIVKLDEEDFDRVSQHRWCIKQPKPDHVYVTTTIAGKTIMLHRFIMDAPEGLVVDHRDFDGCNNQKQNLRVCSYSDNNHNQRAQKKVTNTSKFKGVFFDKKAGKFRSVLHSEAGDQYLGTHKNEALAVVAYDIAAIVSHGQFAKPNHGPAVFDEPICDLPTAKLVSRAAIELLRRAGKLQSVPN